MAETKPPAVLLMSLSRDDRVVTTALAGEPTKEEVLTIVALSLGNIEQIMREHFDSETFDVHRFVDDFFRRKRGDPWREYLEACDMTGCIAN